LQDQSNKDVYSNPLDKATGIGGAIIIHGIFFALLLLVGFAAPPQPADTGEGILVNFGTDETGMGLVEPAPSFEQETAPTVKSVAAPIRAAAPQKSAEEALITQDNEEAPKVKKVDPEVERKKVEKAEENKRIREQLEAERIIKEKETIEKNRIAADEKRRSDIENRTKNALGNPQNLGTGSGSEGVTGGPGNQGSLTGSLDSKIRGEGNGTGTKGTGTGDKGISYNLAGRGFRSLPSPKYDYQGEGRVVVDVTVDRMGKVINANAGTKGSTTLDAYLLKVAREAAMTATFDPKPDAPEIQKGTITYNFILK
jgi:colicin import membrane protein